MASWNEMAHRQAGLMTRDQLRDHGVDRFHIRNQVVAQRWLPLSSMVIATTTGVLSREQTMWFGVLEAGTDACVGDLTAAEVAGLTGWHRDRVTVYLPHGNDVDAEVEGVRFIRTRRPLTLLRASGDGLPRLRIEAALLLYASRASSPRTAVGAVAAGVQQRLTTPARLSDCLRTLRPLYRAPLLRAALRDIAGGAESLAEVEVRRMCRAFGLVAPRSQVRRWDSDGRVRYTDCEWLTHDGGEVVLEVDGGFHMDAAQWEDDMVRERALTTTDRVVVRCTSRELRDCPDMVARDLRRLGVPSQPWAATSAPERTVRRPRRASAG